MSLKTVHILLILVSITLAFWFGAFELRRFDELRNLSDLILGIGSSVSGFALLAYGYYFLKKTRHISYL
jgi:hypothetical protein